MADRINADEALRRDVMANWADHETGYKGPAPAQAAEMDDDIAAGRDAMWTDALASPDRDALLLTDEESGSPRRSPTQPDPPSRSSTSRS
jgi:hypothetical protein